MHGRSVCLPFALAALALSLTGAAADTKTMRIALSNSYAGNSWRLAMLRSWERSAKQAIDAGLIAEAPALTTDDNDDWSQAEQIRALTRDHYDAIVINATSPTAVNDAVKEACDAGIVVVSFDNTVSEPCAYRLTVDFQKLGAMQIDYFKQRGLRGNLLEVRGIAGTPVNDSIHEGVHSERRLSSDLRIVASVHGNWTESIAKTAVQGLMPHLPDIVAVTTQGGDGVGVAEAFQEAGRKPPVIFLGNRGDELAWWKQQNEATGYETMSASIAPGSASFAFWFAQKLLSGETLPHDVTLPITVVSQATLDEALKRTDENGIVTADYSRDDVAAFLSQAQN